MKKEGILVNNDIIVIKDDITGELKEVDVSLVAASRTMEDIKRAVAVINDSHSKPETIIEKLVELEGIILEKARYMQRLYAMPIKMFDKVFELVNHYDEIKKTKDNCIYNYYITKVNSALERGALNTLDARLSNMLDALLSIERGIAIVGDDELLKTYRQMIVDEYNSVKPKNRAPLT